MKKSIIVFLLFFCGKIYSQSPVPDTIELTNLIAELSDCCNDIKGRVLSDTLNRIEHISKVIIKGTFDNIIYIGKDSALNNTYTPCSYSAVIRDSLNENDAKRLTRSWKKKLHTLLTDEQAILYSNDLGGFESTEPLQIHYSLRKDGLELMVYRVQHEDKKLWLVGLFFVKRI